MESSQALIIDMVGHGSAPENDSSFSASIDTPPPTSVMLPSIPHSALEAGSGGGAAAIVCAVCGSGADGQHFGADACRACAAFFRRTVARGLKYVCRFSGDCEVADSKLL